MILSIYINKSSLSHIVPSGHPERSDRFKILNKLINEKFSANIVKYKKTKDITKYILLNHSKAYLDSVIKKIPENGIESLDADTFLSEHSFHAATDSISAAISAVNDVVLGRTKHAFVCSRPPGHHAEPDKAMGFCIFSNAAIISKYAQKKFKLNKIAVLDFDIHHGNGTQASFLNEENLYLFSSHEMPLYPGTGYPEEIGLGNIFNYPLPQNCESKEFLSCWTENIIPKVKEVNPDLIVLSAGFDAHYADPLSTAKLHSKDYETLTKEIISISSSVCENKIISLLEGGYNLNALKESVEYHLNQLNT